MGVWSSLCDYQRLVAWPTTVVGLVGLSLVYLFIPVQTNNWPFTSLNEFLYEFHVTQDPLVPNWYLGIWAIFGLVLVVLAEWRCPRNVSARARKVMIFNLVAGYAEAISLMLCTVELYKHWVGEPRPDFRDRCIGDNTTTLPPGVTINCTNSDHAEVTEGRQSFPSGHSAMGLVVATYVCGYLIWLVYIRKVELPWRQGETWRCSIALASLFYILCILPLIMGLSIGISRIVDHRHSPADVLAGFFIGFLFGLGSLVKTLSFAQSAVAMAGHRHYRAPLDGEEVTELISTHFENE